jgi:hypothetical protein
MYKVIILAEMSTAHLMDTAPKPLSGTFVGMGRSPKKALAAARREMDRVYDDPKTIFPLIVETLVDASGKVLSQYAHSRNTMRIAWLQDWRDGLLTAIEEEIAEHIGAPVHYTRMQRGRGNHA